MTAISRWEKLRPWPVYLMAATLPISLAATNVAKLLMLAFGLVAVWLDWRGRSPSAPLFPRWTPRVVMLMLAAMALSLAWTSESMSRALSDLAKHAKLLEILLVLLLVRSRREAWTALGVYIAVQTFVVLSSYLLMAGVTPPWVYKADRKSLGSVFSSYIDQSAMTTGMAVVCWHLRERLPRGVGVGLALLAVVNVLFLLPGRSGHLALIGVMSLAALWAVPARWRPAMVLAPVALAAAAMLTSHQFNQRISMAFAETQAYSQEDDNTTSIGQRLHFWHRSLQAIDERPLSGFGVGTWNQQYRRLDGGAPTVFTAQVRNPHQEFLLWGVALGVGGVLLVVALLAALALDAQRFAPPARQATQSIVAALAIVSLFNSPLYDALIGDYFCLMLGVLLAYGLHERKETLAAETTGRLAPQPVPATA